jgi:hypothetical protein
MGQRRWRYSTCRVVSVSQIAVDLGIEANVLGTMATGVASATQAGLCG